MKNKVFFASAIVLSLGLAACSPAEKNKEVPVETPAVVDEQTKETTTTTTTTTGKTDPEDDAKQDLTDAKDKIKTEEVKVEEKVDGLMTSDEEMIAASDYIAIVKIVDVGDGLLKAELVKDLKGTLEGKEIPNDENFKKDKEYVVFLKDDAGKVVPVNDANHYRDYDGENDNLVKKVEAAQ